MNEELHNEALKMAEIAKEALDDKMGEDIKVLDLSGLSNIADFFVIGSGSNPNQLWQTVQTKSFLKPDISFIIRKDIPAEPGYFLITAIL